MRLGWTSGSLLFALAALLSTAVGCTCEMETPEPTVTEPEPEAPDEPEAEPALLEGRRAVEGGYFEIAVPEGWTARRTLRATVLEAPAETARLSIRVGRPVPFEGDAAAYAEALRPAFEAAGFEGDPGHEGQLGDVTAQVVDGISTGATARYWFVVADGHGTSVSCTGRVAAAEQIHAACDDIAESFRLTGSMAAHALLESGGEVTVGTFHFTKPEGWEVFDPGAQAGVVVALRRAAVPRDEDEDEEEEEETQVSMGATLTTRPFGDDLAALQAQARLTASEGGHTIEIAEGTLLSQPAATYDIVQPAELGGRRARVIETVSEGRAVRLSCYSAPDAFDQVSTACDTIVQSLRE